MNNQEKSTSVENEKFVQKLEECEKNITDYHKRAPAEAKAWARIEEEELWRYSKENFKNFAEYKKSKKLSVSYLSRVLRCGHFYLDAGIPEGMEPPETALRPLLKRCYKKSDQIIVYKNACCIRKKIENDGHPTEQEPDSDFIIDVIPYAEDIREAIKCWEQGKEEADNIFIKAIEAIVPAGGNFITDVLDKHRSRIHSVAILTAVIKQYTNVTKLNSDATSAIDEFAHTLQKGELEKLKIALCKES